MRINLYGGTVKPQSNWRDGFVRSAMLLDNETYKKQTDAYVEEILKTQDADGYLGIYDEKLRFKCTGENGELWPSPRCLGRCWPTVRPGIIPRF